MARSVAYESLLELRFFEWIDQVDQIAFYQEQPLCVPYEHETQPYTYYPDVLLVLNDGRGVVVEIKPIFQMAIQSNLRKWKALRRYCSDNGLGWLVTDGSMTFQQLQNFGVNPDFEKYILTELKKGTLTWFKYKPIKDKYMVNRNEFVALVLKYELEWWLSPFMLSLPSQD